MQGLSAFRVAHCCPPLPFSGCSRLASPAPQQHLLLLGFHQPSNFFKYGRDSLAPASRRLKTSPQDEVATEGGLLRLAEEEILMKLATEDFSTNNVAGQEGPKVNVKFILEKKCRYGQRFNVVGNDPVFGNWEVEAALPMKWAEGHIWTAEADVPADKQVEFKFVMTGERDELEWQPGSNRVFNTVEGISTLVVSEAWKCPLHDEAEEAGGKPSDLVEDTTSSETDGLSSDLVEDTILSETDVLSSDLVEDTTSSETDGLLVPADIVEAATTVEVVKAFQSNNGADVHKSEPATAPEIPLVELDVVTTVLELDVVTTGVKTTAHGVDDTA